MGWGTDSVCGDLALSAGPKGDPETDSLMDLQLDSKYEAEFTWETEALLQRGRKWKYVAAFVAVAAGVFGVVPSAYLMFGHPMLTTATQERFFTGIIVYVVSECVVPRIDNSGAEFRIIRDTQCVYS